MKHKYPYIDELFEGVSDRVHDSRIGTLLAWRWAMGWISRNILENDQADVALKIQHFIQAIAPISGPAEQTTLH